MKVAGYGILGDLFEVLPKLTEAAKGPLLLAGLTAAAIGRPPVGVSGKRGSA